MGGDYAPGVVVEGLALALEAYPDYEYVLVGHEEKVRFYLEKYGLAGNKRISTVHAASVCEMSDPSTISLRQKKDSSITVCAKLLKNKQVDAMVTPGHTGATVAATKVILRSLPGVDRPALAACMPAQDGRFLLVDAGDLAQTGQSVELAQDADDGLAVTEGAGEGGLDAGDAALDLKALALQGDAQGLGGNELGKSGFGIVPNLVGNFADQRSLLVDHLKCLLLFISHGNYLLVISQ